MDISESWEIRDDDLAQDTDTTAQMVGQGTYYLATRYQGGQSSNGLFLCRTVMMANRHPVMDFCGRRSSVEAVLQPEYGPCRWCHLNGERSTLISEDINELQEYTSSAERMARLRSDNALFCTVL